MTSTPRVADSGWLPELPSDWKIVPAKVLFGHRTEPSNPKDQHLTPSQKHGVVTQARYMEMTGARVVLNLSGADNMKHVEPGDFIIHLRSFQGGIEHSLLEGKVSTAYTVLSPRSRVDGRYYGYLLKSDRYIQTLSVVVNQLRDGQSIRYQDFGKVALPWPSFNEQRRIADFLDRQTAQIDALIEKQEKLIQLLSDRRSDLIWRTTTQGLGEFPQLTPVNHIPWLADLPVAWKMGRVHYDHSVILGKMLDAGRSATPDDIVTPYIRAANIQDDGLDLADVKSMPFLASELRRLDIVKGDLLVVEGGSVGTSYWVAEDMPGWSFQKTVNRVRSRGRGSTRFLSYVLRGFKDRGLIALICDGSTFAHLTAEKLRALRMPKPPYEVQEELADFLDREVARIDAAVVKTKQFIELTRERRAALITAAVTGQSDVTSKEAV